MVMSNKFTWFDVELEYEDHEYNTTRLNERAVEIPIAQEWLDRQIGVTPFSRILEVGNVFGHYYPDHWKWDVIDLYEKARGVKNINVLDVSESYDYIFSISTLEHVGDEKMATEKSL